MWVTISPEGGGWGEGGENELNVGCNAYLDFPHVGQVFCIRRTTTDLDGNVVKGRKSPQETIYGVTSLSPQRATPAEVRAHNRGHWQIENHLHHVRDMTYDEDRSQDPQPGLCP